MKLDADEVRDRSEIFAIAGALDLKLEGNGKEKFCRIREDDHTPSCAINAAKGLWHDHGSGEGGNVFQLVMRVRGCGFQEAVEFVAERSGFSVANSHNVHRTNRAPKVNDQKTAKPVAPKADASPSAKIFETYAYVDEQGQLLYEVVRLEPKSFRQRRPDGNGGWTWGLGDVRRVLYRLPQVLTAEIVYVVEGEKDCHSLERAGAVATTPSGGASAPWQPEFTEALAGKSVIVIPDNDAPGKKRAEEIVKELAGKTAEVLLVELPSDSKDVTEFFEAGYVFDDLAELVEKTRRRVRLEKLEQRGLLLPRQIVETIDGGVSALMTPPKGLPTGFDGLDDLTNGLHRGELIILGGRPAMGKTALALNIAEHAIRSGRTVAFFSYEMSRPSLLVRMICGQARINSRRYRAGMLDADERRRFAKALGEISNLPVLIDDRCPPLKLMRSRVLRIRQEMGLGLVVVDYLQLAAAGTGRNRNDEVGAASRALKLLAGELGVPFLVLSQLSRATETRKGNQRPQLSDLRDSGSIEQDADVVLLVYREEEYKPDRQDLEGIAEVIIAKQRNGETGRVKLAFIKSLTKFENLATGYGSTDE